MRILYVASDIPLSANHGGAVHVREVASGLAELGHAVRVVVKGRAGEPQRSQEPGFQVRRVLRGVPGRVLRLLSLPAVAREVRDFRPDTIIERYYNFGGEGVVCANRHSLPAVLEVNSPLIEYQGSLKARLDRLLGSPLRRWREYLARNVAAFVTPSAAILPSFVPRDRIHELPWGANTERFRPDVLPARVPQTEGRTVVAFVGSFRPWHGARMLVEAAAELRRMSAHVPLFLMIGDGPERRAIEQRARTSGHCANFHFVGSVPYAEVPSCLRLAQIGVAPFEPRRHRYLEIDFYWSPFKVLEYMAMALPVVTIDVPALRRVVRPGAEGILFPEGDIHALASALRRLIEAPEEARAMGLAARQRAVEHFSWRKHCAALEEILRQVTVS
ncbi:MAG TPA: glycosyltransferase family 4 protein [Candidatus Binatia bacterium]|nr:glycosyltransferase family 4 protein [Candidatus Binatia bacterium]